MGHEDPWRDRKQFQQRIHLHAARAGRGGGRDRGVEFSAAAGELEAGARPGLRKHCDSETSGANAADRSALWRTGFGGWAAAGRAEYWAGGAANRLGGSPASK